VEATGLGIEGHETKWAIFFAPNNKQPGTEDDETKWALFLGSNQQDNKRQNESCFWAPNNRTTTNKEGHQTKRGLVLGSTQQEKCQTANGFQLQNKLPDNFLNGHKQ